MYRYIIPEIFLCIAKSKRTLINESRRLQRKEHEMPMALNVENTEDLQGLTDIFDEEAAIMIE